MKIVTIEGIDFENHHRGEYVRFDKVVDIMVSQQDSHSWDIYIHEKETGDVTDQKMFSTKEMCVKWAKAKQYIRD